VWGGLGELKSPVKYKADGDMAPPAQMALSCFLVRRGLITERACRGLRIDAAGLGTNKKTQPAAVIFSYPIRNEYHTEKRRYSED